MAGQAKSARDISTGSRMAHVHTQVCACGTATGRRPKALDLRITTGDGWPGHSLQSEPRVDPLSYLIGTAHLDRRPVGHLRRRVQPIRGIPG